MTCNRRSTEGGFPIKRTLGERVRCHGRHPCRRSRHPRRCPASIATRDARRAVARGGARTVPGTIDGRRRSSSPRSERWEYTVEAWVDRFAIVADRVSWPSSTPARTSRASCSKVRSSFRRRCGVASQPGRLDGACGRRPPAARSSPTSCAAPRRSARARDSRARSAELAADAIRARTATPPRSIRHCESRSIRCMARFSALVRDVSALVHDRPARAAARSATPRVAPRRHRGDGLRRPVSATRSSDRHDPSQGTQQLARRRSRTIREVRGRSAAPSRRPHGHSPRARARWTTSSASCRSRIASVSRSRSTSPSRRRRIIRGSASIRRGSAIVPTARSSTPRTRPRSIRTSIRSISRAATGVHCGHALRDVFLFWIDRGVTHLPRRQSAHQVVPLLGVVHRQRQAAASGCRSSSPRPSPGRR